ncbi:hypothetical protein CapIbe_001843 [Capra ibex]
MAPPLLKAKGRLCEGNSHGNTFLIAKCHVPERDAWLTLGLVRTSEQTLSKALMNGDRRLVERSKGGQRPAASPADKPGNLEQVPDPLWASVSQSVNEETGLGPLCGSFQLWRL